MRRQKKFDDLSDSSDEIEEEEQNEEEFENDEDEEEDENGEQEEQKNLPWQPLPTLEEERDEQARERNMQLAALELRLKTPINNKNGLLRIVENICFVDNEDSLISSEIPHITPTSDKANWLVHQCTVSSAPTSES